MWKKLTPSEQAVLLGKAILGAGMTLLAAGLGYFSYQLGAARYELPTLLTQVENTSQKVEPVLHEAGAIRELVPAILKETKAIREVIAVTVTEAAALRKALPPLVDTSAAAVNNVSRAAQAMEPHIPSVLSEIQKTREALPGILDRAENMAGRAEKIGQSAGKGAVTGMLGGIITAPFKLIGNVGKGLSDTIGLGGQSEFTAEDDRLTRLATDAILKTGAPGAQRAWQNPASGNEGNVGWLSQRVHAGRTCATLRYHVKFKSAKSHEAKVEICQQPDASWVKTGSE